MHVKSCILCKEKKVYELKILGHHKVGGGFRPSGKAY